MKIWRYTRAIYEMKAIWKKHVVAYSVYSHIIFLTGLRKTMKKVSHNSWCPGPRFKTGTSRVQNCSAAAAPNCSVSFCNAELWIQKNDSVKLHFSFTLAVRCWGTLTLLMFHPHNANIKLIIQLMNFVSRETSVSCVSCKKQKKQGSL